MKHMKRRNALAGMGALTGAALFSGCAVNPVTGKKEFMLMSEREEIKMGAEAHGQIVAEYGSLDDDSLQNWFNNKGKEMSAVTHRKNLTYTFTVLDSPVVNAFAVPGGYVYVTRGIMGYFNNESQFAGVLGHELGHVNARHTAARFSKSKVATIGLALGSAISDEFAQYSQLASLGASLLFLRFSRDDEREADKLSVDYASAVGYDTIEISEFFKTLERLHPGGGSLPAWQSTHPDPGDRVAATRKMSLEYQKKHADMKFVVKRNEYLERIDGLVYGDDPRQGYVKDGMFYHPGMMFQFPVPAGWQVANQPSQVKMSKKGENALLMFSAAPGTTPAEASTAFAAGNEITVEATTPITVNGMSGIRTTGSMGTGENAAAIVSSYLPMKGAVYAFHGLSAPAELAKYTGIFDETANGFATISDMKLTNVSPRKFQVRKVDSPSTVQAMFNRFGVPKEDIDQLAIMNGVQLADTLPAGTLMKIID